jgi:MYXO-CTERM domain-containing protein
VGQSDYASWKDGFGEFAGSGAIAATGGVPEPATGVLAALAMLMFAWHRSRR